MFEWIPPAHGTVAFPRLTTGEPVEAFCDRCVQEAGVLLLPATVYDHEPSTAQVCAVPRTGCTSTHWHRDDFALALGGRTCRRAWKHWKRTCNANRSGKLHNWLCCRLQSLHVLLQADNLRCHVTQGCKHTHFSAHLGFLFCLFLLDGLQGGLYPREFV